MTTDIKKEETRISKLYETVIKAEESPSEFLLPESVTTSGLKTYVEDMIRVAQPRHLRKEGRTSHSLDDYKVPINYFVVESNTVPFHSSTGYFPDLEDNIEDEEDEEDGIIKVDEEGYLIIEEEVEDTKKEKARIESNPVLKAAYSLRKYREDDIGAQIIIHIFKHGRKTIDELIRELTGLDKHMLTILVNKLIADGYLEVCIDNSDDSDGHKIKTLEIIQKKKKLITTTS